MDNELEFYTKEYKEQNSTIKDLLVKRLAREKSLTELRADQLRKIKEVVSFPEEGRLYYPACGVDNSPSLAFPEFDIVYLDYNNTQISGTNPKDIFLQGDLMHHSFDNEEIQFDVAMLVSPGEHLKSFSPQYIEAVVKNLKKEGLLICDNYHDTADDVESKLRDKFIKVDVQIQNLVFFERLRIDG